MDERLQANRELNIVLDGSRRAQARCFESNDKHNGFHSERRSAQVAERLMPE